MGWVKLDGWVGAVLGYLGWWLCGRSVRNSHLGGKWLWRSFGMPGELYEISTWVGNDEFLRNSRLGGKWWVIFRVEGFGWKICEIFWLDEDFGFEKLAVSFGVRNFLMLWRKLIRIFANSWFERPFVNSHYRQFREPQSITSKPWHNRTNKPFFHCNCSWFLVYNKYFNL